MQSIGRPSLINSTLTNKLTAFFERGLSDSTACKLAGIGRTTFYKYLKQDEEFASKISYAKNFCKVLASDLTLDILLDIERERKGEKIKYSKTERVKTALWYLERKDPQSFGKLVCKRSCCEDALLSNKSLL